MRGARRTSIVIEAIAPKNEYSQKSFSAAALARSRGCCNQVPAPLTASLVALLILGLLPLVISNEGSSLFNTVSFLLVYSCPIFWIACHFKGVVARSLDDRARDNNFSSTPREAAIHYPTEHYLAFLRMCRNLFCVLSVVSFPWVSSVWGVGYFLWFMAPPVESAQSSFHPAVTTSLSESTDILCLISLTLVRSVCAFYFVVNFQRDTFGVLQRTSKEERTLWLSNIPVQDQATLQQHVMDLQDFEHVERDLNKAIMDHLRTGGKRSKDDNEQMTRHMVLPPCACGIFRCKMACACACSCCPCIEKKVPAQQAMDPEEEDSLPENLIEAVFVQPVMDKYLEYIDLYRSIEKKIERVQTYNLRLKQAGESSRRFLSRWYYRMKHQNSQAELQRLRNQFEDARILVDNMRMSGHAFVVFTDRTYRDLMLHPVRTWWQFRDHTAFRFGRPPFTSVTLQGRTAPHPSDMQWENLHVGSFPTIKGVLNGLLLSVVIVLVVFVIAISSQLDKLSDCQEETSAVSNHWPLVCATSRWVMSHHLTGQVPTVALLTFNSLVVPAWIEAISKQRRFAKRSENELQQMKLNFWMLMMSKFVMPLVSIVAADAVVSGIQNQDWTVFFADLSDILGKGRDAIGEAGLFYLKYTLNCAFLSNSITLLQVGRSFSRLVLTACAVTETDKREAREPFPFAWGYWYAWSLSIAGIGLIMSVTVPSMAPVSFIAFALKYYVDTILLKDLRAWDLHQDSMGFYPPHVAHYMYIIIAAVMVIHGFGVILILQSCEKCWQGGTPTFAAVGGNRFWILFGGVALVVIGLSLYFLSLVSKLQHTLNESFPDPGDEERISAPFLHRLGGLLVSGCQQFFQASQGVEYCRSRARSVDSLSERLLKKRPSWRRTMDIHDTEGEDLTWDAAQFFAQRELDNASQMPNDDRERLRGHLCELLGGRKTRSNTFERVSSASIPKLLRTASRLERPESFTEGDFSEAALAGLRQGDDAGEGHGADNREMAEEQIAHMTQQQPSVPLMAG